jgi:hypothetical protein
MCSRVAPNRIQSSPKPVRIPLAAGLEAHAVAQLAARPDLLQRLEAPVLVVDRGEAVADKLFGDVRRAVVAPALQLGR